MTYFRDCPPAVTRGLAGAFNADNRPGDWDNGTGRIEDGPYINKADEAMPPRTIRPMTRTWDTSRADLSMWRPDLPTARTARLPQPWPLVPCLWDFWIEPFRVITDYGGAPAMADPLVLSEPRLSLDGGFK
ncbi:hypothetical protein [Verrucomicrobium spinosum]|uniref:hypothetical protein n=1 Tax=Verrucomicrobium spinosum TaxID=2736 RepID=UPI00210D8545|nr:hypothetical protein [Verrucomicrobium spinosum]